MENFLQKMYTEKGYDIKVDNRSYFVKVINKIIFRGKVEITIAPIGKVYTSKKNFKYDLKVSLNGKSCVMNTHAKVPLPENICNLIAKLIRREDVKGVLYNTSEVCTKCMGTGIIPMFLHYAEGVCFDCMGIGFINR